MGAAHDISINLLLEFSMNGKLRLVLMFFLSLLHLEEALIIFTATATVNDMLTIVNVTIIIVRARKLSDIKLFHFFNSIEIMLLKESLF